MLFWAQNGEAAKLLGLTQGNLDGFPLGFKPDINVVCQTNKITPLQYATTGGHPVCVKVLLDAGADIYYREKKHNQTAEESIKEYLEHPFRMCDKAEEKAKIPDMKKCLELLQAARAEAETEAAALAAASAAAQKKMMTQALVAVLIVFVLAAARALF